MPFPTWQSLPAMFFDQAGQLDGQPFLWCKRDGTWQSLSYGEVAGKVRRVARSLQALGVAPGDRIGLVAENRPEWKVGPRPRTREKRGPKRQASPRGKASSTPKGENSDEPVEW